MPYTVVPRAWPRPHARMRFSVLALDYDGTIAEDGRLNEEVRAAIGDVRGRGISVVLVTGRTLRDLRRLLGDLRLFDAVVAENGAVFAHPSSGRTNVLGAPPPPDFLRGMCTAQGSALKCGRVDKREGAG